MYMYLFKEPVLQFLVPTCMTKQEIPVGSGSISMQMRRPLDFVMSFLAHT